MTIPVVRLYSKPGCHLCEQAEELLDEISRECPLAVEQIDITTDVDLFERYRYEIPVVAVEGGGSVFGRVTLDENGMGVPWYSLTDELDLQMTHSSIEAQVRLHKAAGAAPRN